MVIANKNYAPGARVEIRDTEWVVRRIDVSSDKGHQLTCDGISELVRGKTGIFLTQLEDEIKILDPATTELIQDTSNAFEQSLLYLESQLRQATANDTDIHVAHRAAMDVVPYQLDPAIQALRQPRQRILIADAVGLGKTLEAGILVTELIQRGRGQRILVLTLKSMMTQFQKEFWNRFTIPLTRLDSAGLQRVRSRIPGNHNPFYYFDKSIISIDTLKQDNEFKGYLEQAYWDIIVIDEAHNVADRGTSSQRTQLAQLLASRSDTLIMLSATPHDGRARSFASLMNMLDPTAISDPEEYAKEDFQSKGLVVRRFKKDIRDQIDTEFKERTVHCLKHNASPEEEAVYEALLNVPFTYKGQYNPEKQGHLVRISMQKALFSSPAACAESVRQRLKKLTQVVVNEDLQAEINGLESLLLALDNISQEQWTKYQAFIDLLKGKAFAWKKSNTGDRLVIFSERLETLRFLEEKLQQELKLKPNQITQLHGGMSDIEQQEIVEKFGKPEEKLRVLLCSDVASEGINLHYLSHRLIHFDLPWSLMVFQQRNGRVDRYGQTRDPHIYYLITESANETIRGDTRILEILQQKDEQAYKNIGDPATFMKVHNTEEEERLTEQAMAEGLGATQFDQKYQADESNEGDELLTLFLAGDTEQSSEKTELPVAKGFSIYSDDYHFAKAAFEYLNREKPIADVSYNDTSRLISLIAPDDLRERFRFMPAEIWPENGQFLLTANVESYQEEIKRSRNDEHAWPKQHYLWSKHPAISWLQERMLGNTGRHQALVMGLNSELKSDESLFLVSALIPNRKAHPVIWSWYAVRCQGNKVQAIESLKRLMETMELGKKPRPNTTQPVNMQRLQALRKPVVDAVRTKVLQAREALEQEVNPKLQAQLDELNRLRGAQVQQLELSLARSQQDPHFKASKKNQRMKFIDKVFTEYEHWMEDTMKTEPSPYIQIMAVIARVET
ncbi:MAG: DEAD/DEAH box helicase [Candidatus Thiodiazotropha sp.]|nr:DEAD/DEAH box helicase [Candidatus Thiodiazotropha sp.]MCM8920628.1 DEAD/DEAH box helicase [Candidatus Thiodiazotropha sp.]